MASAPTILDRRIVTILPHPDDTPSSRDKISMTDERIHRLYGVSLVSDACEILQYPHRLVFPTATTLFHRFYHQVSLHSADVWSTAMACTVLAAKIHEVAVPMRHVIVAYVHVLLRRRRRRGSTTTATYTINPAPIPTYLYRSWHTILVQAESELLRRLGFVVYWIPDSHPHLFVEPFVAATTIVNNKNNKQQESTLIQAALHLCDTAVHLDVGTRHRPGTIAAAAVWVAHLQLDTTPSIPRPGPFCDALCGRDERDAMLCLANGILGLLNDKDTTLQTARSGYLPSLCTAQEKSGFHGPGSAAWEFIEHQGEE